jgi:hypothetical protein
LKSTLIAGTIRVHMQADALMRLLDSVDDCYTHADWLAAGVPTYKTASRPVKNWKYGS